MEDRLPDQLSQAFIITGLLIGMASASGQTSLIKMLFELEQLIEFHIYLNLEIPVVFKEFIEALSSFKFLDLTTFIPGNAFDSISGLSSDELDAKGPVKAIFYDNGANYYKNMAPVVISFCAILLINLLIMKLFRCMPCRIVALLG